MASPFFVARSLGLALVLAGWVVSHAASTPPNTEPLAKPSGQSDRQVGFTSLSSQATGVCFTNHLPFARYRTNQIYLNGSGVAAADIDGDGRCDLFFAGLNGESRLYRNLGQWRFEDATEISGVACPQIDATGAAFADLDGDRSPDLVVNSIAGGTQVFLNDGRGHFRRSQVLNQRFAGHSMALADLDGDGDLDLYIANYRSSMLRDRPPTKFRVKVIEGHPQITSVDDRPVSEPDLENRFQVDLQGKLLELGEPDAVFVNDGHGKFAPASFTDGMFLDELGHPLKHPPFDWSLSVVARDLNQDGLPDLYICSDFSTPDRVWLNDGHGHFRALPALALRTTTMFSMGVAVADVNRDGMDDLLVSDMLSRSHSRRMVQVGDVAPYFPEVGRIDDRPQYSRNTLLLARGDGTYAEISRFAGIAASEWTWCPVFLDVDLDGYEDLLTTTGNERDAMNGDVAEQIKTTRQQQSLSRDQVLDLNRMYGRLVTPTLAFRNRGDLTFEEVGEKWGYNLVGVSQGQALADLDGDGDLDIAINVLNGEAALFRNDATAPRLAVRLVGSAPNTQGVGARLTVTGGPVSQSQVVMAGGLYLSSSEPRCVFAAGAPTNLLKLEVRWPHGRVSLIEGIPANRLITVVEPQDPPGPSASVHAETTMFVDMSDRLNHQHVETAFDDFARQPLLPKKLSQLGPGVTWADVTGDGFDDLIVGAGNGGSLAVMINDRQGGFQPSKEPPLNYAVTRDQTTVLAWPRTQREWVLIAGSANYEDGLNVGPIARQYDLAGHRMDDSLPPAAWSAGALSLADFDADGVLELVVAGRCVGGRYPDPAPVRVFKHGKEGWLPLRENAGLPETVGLIAGMTCTDLTGDGWPELVVASEWGALRIYRNVHGNLESWDPEVRGSLRDAGPVRKLSELTGWWQAVASVDLDGDGRLDLVAANWGLNTFHQPAPGHPMRLYAGDFDGSGGVSLVEACFDAELQREVPVRSWKSMRAALPFLEETFTNHAAYGAASIASLLGHRLPSAKVLEAATLCSVVLLNRGDHFELRALPDEAQWAPAFGICVADFNGDGAEDVFISQNFFAVQSEDWRYDAGRGLLLQGDGRGNLQPVPGQLSGIAVYGEQRGVATADYDRDGRPDLAIAQSGNATRLFRNQTGHPGLRVRLAGPAGNSLGLGAVLQAGRDNQWGPAREIHAGSGYWSQDSATAILASSGTIEQVRVRWPGGKETRHRIPTQTKDVILDFGGATLPNAAP